MVISLTLSDGTKVWLNSESSLKYPTAFNGNAREVEITGEAYFEVRSQESGARSGASPFIVRKKDVSVTVLGTHFNVNAYDDEDVIKVTLLEGSVRMSSLLEDQGASLRGGIPRASGQSQLKSVILKPGEQGVVTQNSELRTQNSVDLEAVMAWKNGKFIFNETSIDVIMKQISRWYDVEVEYVGAKPDVHFIGDISRRENISEVLKMLEQTKAVKFSIEGEKIKVMR